MYKKNGFIQKLSESQQIIYHLVCSFLEICWKNDVQLAQR